MEASYTGMISQTKMGADRTAHYREQGNVGRERARHPAISERGILDSAHGCDTI